MWSSAGMERMSTETLLLAYRYAGKFLFFLAGTVSLRIIIDNIW